jgi:hypothetical protein
MYVQLPATPQNYEVKYEIRMKEDSFICSRGIEQK